MISRKTIIVGVFILFSQLLSAQEEKVSKAAYSGFVSEMEHVPSIASRAKLEPSQTKKTQMLDGRASGNIIVPQKDSQSENDFFVLNPNPLSGKLKGQSPDLVFNAYTSSSEPTDPALAVGPNHVFVVFNVGFIIYDKKGNALTPQIAPNPTIFPSGGCCDLTISYDNSANRWVISFLKDSGGAQIAVSDGPDPINDGWYTYTISQIKDYQKLSIWSDGYYITDNTQATNKVWALERDQMLIGNPSPKIIGFDLPGIKTNGFYSPQVLSISNGNMPQKGNVPVVFLQDDAWTGVTQDHLKIWHINVDWKNTENSTISQPQVINNTPFMSVFDNGNFSNLTQPLGGKDIDALQSAIMNQAQFRKFSNYNSAVFNFVVDTDASSVELAGIRWVELRQNGDGQPWTLYQEGTYIAPNGRHAWNASMMMDAQGNIGLGYSSMSGPTTQTTTYVGSYYTGRFANDPLGTMTLTEELIGLGNANIPTIRFGDYGKMDIDPVNEKAFWYINEYMNNGRKGVVGVFQIAPTYGNDIGVVNLINPTDATLTSNETITIKIFNYGNKTVSNFPISYQIDGGTIVTETFSGSIASVSYAEYTFTAKVNLSQIGHTYNIKVYTSLTTDEDVSNDSKIFSVKHLYPNDLGVISIFSPQSGSGLTNSETIKVIVKNFGGAPQSNFDIYYNLDGTIVKEVFTGTIAPNSTIPYTFIQKGDFFDIGSYNLNCYTSLPGDVDTTNDSYTTIIINQTCQPNSNCNIGDDIKLVKVGDINNPSGCGESGYTDFTNIKTNLATNASYDLTIVTGESDQFLSVWIDYNDNFIFESSERIISNQAIVTSQTNDTYKETFQLVIPANANLGEHLMRVKTNWDANVPDNACEETQYGETEDYTVNIFDGNNLLLSEAEMVIKNFDFRQFEIELETSYKELVEFTVYNTLGQRLVYHKLRNEGIKFTYSLDMSYVVPGVYLVRMGNMDFGKVKKIIVK